MKIIKPDVNGVFPIINDDDLDSKIIVVVDEYNEERLPVSYFLLENQSKVLYHIPSMNIVNSHINLCQTELSDYQNLFRILGSKYKPLWAITHFIVFDNIYEYMEWKARTIPVQR